MKMNSTHYLDHQHQFQWMDDPRKQGNGTIDSNVSYANIDAKQQLNYGDVPSDNICKSDNEPIDTSINLTYVNEIPDSNTTNFISSNKTAETADTNATTHTNETYIVDPIEAQQFDSNYYTIKTNYDETQPPVNSNNYAYSNDGYNLFAGNMPSSDCYYYQTQPMGNSAGGIGYYNDIYQTISPAFVGLPMSLPASPYMACSRSPAQSVMGDYDTDNFMINTLSQMSTPSSPCYRPVYNGYGKFLVDSAPQFTLTQSALSPNMNYTMDMGMNMNTNCGYEELDDSFYAIVDEIVENTKYLPPKNSEVKCSLDANHPIHCVWKDMNRGHFSWRCRWWENGKRLSKNFNIKRFGDMEAMKMAITMKLKNSTPSERLQLLKEQREVVRVNMEKRHSNPPIDLLTTVSGQFPTPVSTIQPPSPNISDYSCDNDEYSVKIQDENFKRLSWAYTMLDRHANGKDSNLRCKICRKTIKSSRGSNIEQSFFLHLFRMHKNPWKQYVDVRGLDSASKNMLNNLYSFHGINDRTPWKVNSSLCRP
ncbi:transcription factor with AP2 domain(s) (AP2-G) [Babesia microti strain RI]|uniref:Transcription factor with AP2 domain(S) (AP2-G) n=1 Tax=Babesia microti (strain RI) TaxID=1133968 RepID=I7I8C9_BABMR|nr:transcription factor with AP2 domain(s) (AP2-G) [Babesia microti strain RI]CCF73073.1 transcription factor with AP2 domain(s) (AP2-G) [Babesia microti strain RI]|eukprot:XP_012647682.1 transcription factor with AP2 domain(s) (AP2-G) [Babesia microti strain RI]